MFEPAMLRLCRRLLRGATVCRAPARMPLHDQAAREEELRGLSVEGRLRGVTRAQEDLRRAPGRCGRAQQALRVVDESGEDYLYSRERFAPLKLPRGLQQALAAAG